MKKISANLLIIHLCLFVGFTSCTKDELTKPASVNLSMEIVKDEVNLRTNSSGPAVKINKTHYVFSEMEFQGYRQSGNDYFFTKKFEEGLEVTVEEGKPTSLLSFDMPQGVYDRINISLKVLKNTEASIVMEGFYTNNKMEAIPLIFIYNFDEVFEYPARPGNNSSTISVSKASSNEATIQFSPSYWMQLINARMLQGAKLDLIAGRPTIVISEESNTHIFNLLTSRIKNASELKFQ